MTRILLITPYFYPHKGGSQEYALELYSHLMEAEPDVKVDVLCYNTDKVAKKENYRGFTIYRVPCLQILPGQFALPNYFSLLKLLKRLKRKNRYAFVNAHTRFFESSWWAPLAAKYLKTKAVLTDHCASHPTHSSSMVNSITKAVDKLIVPPVSKSYDKITVISQATQNFVKGLGMKNPVLISAGVDTEYFKPTKKNGVMTIPHLEKTFKQDDVIVSFVGRMIPSKGPQLLLEAAKDLIKNYSNIHMVFAGDGKMCAKLNKKPVKQVYFLGKLEKKDVAQLLKMTDIFVYPSMHSEGLPIAILEAGASGCAVITTDSGSIKEIITNNKTGLLVKPTAKDIKQNLRLLLENESKRKVLGSNLRKLIKSKYDWDLIVKEYQNFINLQVLKRIN